MLEKDIGGKMRFNRYVLYPILTAVSWTVYFGVTNYMVKKAILTPVQTVFYCELAILIICAIVLLIFIFTKKISPQSLRLDRKHLFLYILL